ncbi:MAG: porin [Phycisphaerales bacterium]
MIRALVGALAAAGCAGAAIADGGHDGAFFIADDNGQRLEVSGFLQFRWTGVSRDAPQEPDIEHGFEFRRVRLTFEGTVLDPRLSFKITPSFSRNGGDAGFSDAYIDYELDEGVVIRMGQFKPPLLAEELMSAKRQLAADRSMTNSVFTLQRSQGVMLEWERDRWRGAASINDGARAAESAWHDDDSDFAATARVERLLDGAFRQFRAFSAPRETERGWLVGGAAHYELGADRPGEDPTSAVTGTLDSMWQGDGWNAFVAAMARYTGDDPAVGNALDAGLVAQAGRFLTDDIEGFLRWDGVLPDGDRPGDELFQTVTIGANWYIHGHALKLTTDLQWFPDRASDNDLVSTNAGVGYLDDGADRNEIVIRAQLQLLF